MQKEACCSTGKASSSMQQCRRSPPHVFTDREVVCRGMIPRRGRQVGKVCIQPNLGSDEE